MAESLSAERLVWSMGGMASAEAGHPLNAAYVTAADYAALTAELTAIELRLREEQKTSMALTGALEQAVSACAECGGVAVYFMARRGYVDCNRCGYWRALLSALRRRQQPQDATGAKEQVDATR